MFLYFYKKTFKMFLTSVLYGNSGVFKRGHSAMHPLWFDHKNFFIGDFIWKDAFFAIFQHVLQNSTMFDGLFSYRYNMR